MTTKDSSDFWTTPVLVKVIFGCVSVSKKSLERRWLSRSAVPVLIEERSTSTLTFESLIGSALTIEPSKVSNFPRTLLMI